MNSDTIQRYLRVALYALFSSLATIGVTIPDNTKTLIAGIVGFMANLAWTIWGNKLSNLLSEAQAKAGVQSVVVAVDPNVVNPAQLQNSTSDGVTVKAAKP